MRDKQLFIFGLGYTGLRFARAAQLLGYTVSGTTRSQSKADKCRAFGIDTLDPSTHEGRQTITKILASQTHILSTVPPDKSWSETNETPPDPVLNYLNTIDASSLAWLGYLSSTGVYGDVDCAWVDETSPSNRGDSESRNAADAAWLALARDDFSVHIFRLPGIYGPGRSMLERAKSGNLRRVHKKGHLRSRIHVDDIVQTLLASIAQPAPGNIYNVADDHPAPGYVVEDEALDLLGMDRTALIDFADADIPERARRFFTQCRRVRNDKIKTELGVRLLYPSFKEGLKACLAEAAYAP